MAFARKTLYNAECGLECLLIELHRGVLNYIRAVGVLLEHSVVAGRERKGSLLRAEFQHGTCKCGAFLRIRTASELVQNHQRILCHGPQDEPDALHVAAEGRKMVFNALVVSDIGEDPVEQGHRTSV